MSPDESLAVIMTRVEGKLDLVNAELRAINVRGDDHEVRLRTLEASRVDPERVAALEARPAGITPAKLLTAVVGIAGIASAMASFVTLLSR